ncbi:MAG: DNA repair exonuclease [Deltaproteobacteria bacterium]
MTPFSFIHTADLHLDSPFTGLRQVGDTVASLIKDATFRAFDNVVDLAIRRKVDFFLVAGDVYDASDRSLRAQLKFADGLRKLAQAGIRSFVCHGNHDPLDGWSASLRWPGGVHIFGPELESVPLALGGCFTVPWVAIPPMRPMPPAQWMNCWPQTWITGLWVTFIHTGC